jgi:hypothetical protein
MKSDGIAFYTIYLRASNQSLIKIFENTTRILIENIKMDTWYSISDYFTVYDDISYQSSFRWNTDEFGVTDHFQLSLLPTPELKTDISIDVRNDNQIEARMKGFEFTPDNCKWFYLIIYFII